MLKQFNILHFEFSLDQVAKFGELWYDYHCKFEEWKAHDTEKLLQGMFEHFMELERLWESVKGQPAAEEEWKPKITTQQKNIKAKVLRVGGKSALGRLMKDQKEFRDSTTDSSDSEVMPASRIREDSVSMSPLRTSLEESVTSGIPEVEAPPIEALASEFGSALANEKLAHELIMDPEFELKGNKDSMQARIQIMAKKAFFDKMREETNSDMMWTAPVFADIRQV